MVHQSSTEGKEIWSVIKVWRVKGCKSASQLYPPRTLSLHGYTSRYGVLSPS